MLAADYSLLTKECHLSPSSIRIEALSLQLLTYSTLWKDVKDEELNKVSPQIRCNTHELRWDLYGPFKHTKQHSSSFTSSLWILHKKHTGEEKIIQPSQVTFQSHHSFHDHSVWNHKVASSLYCPSPLHCFSLWHSNSMYFTFCFVFSSGLPHLNVSFMRTETLFIVLCLQTRTAPDL